MQTVDDLRIIAQRAADAYFDNDDSKLESALYKAYQDARRAYQEALVTRADKFISGGG